jgi:hypothetical protein
MHYYIHHKYKGANHSICVGDSPDQSFEQMPFYTLYRYKGFNHYVCVDVLSDESAD